jgi:hypothetical protein
MLDPLLRRLPVRAGGPPKSKSDLSPARRHLIELLQELNFGRIEGLRVCHGEPVFEPPPRVIREHKFGGESGPHPRLQADDFLLKEQVVDLCRQLDAIGDGVIAVLEVKHGLPFRMLVAEPARIAAA